MLHTKSYYDIINHSNKHQLCIHQGGGRSGKTTGILEGLIRLCLLNQKNNKKGLKIDIFRKHSTSIEKSVYQTFKDILIRANMYDFWVHTKKPLTGTLFGTQIRFFGADDEQKIRSTERDIAYINECQEIDFNIYEAIAMRTRGKIIIDFNPSFNLDHWINTKLKTEPHHFFKTTYLDNPFLSENQKNRLLSYKDKSEYHYKVFTLGEQSTLEGRVFDWNILEINPEAKLIGYGLDWGYVNDPTTLIEIYQLNDNLYFNELLYQNELTNPKLIKILNEYNINKTLPLICDNSDPKSIKELREHNYNAIPTIKDTNSIINGINLLKRFICYVTPQSINLIKELYNYVWQLNKDNNKNTNIPIDIFNHAIDAIRYFVYTTYGKYWHT